MTVRSAERITGMEIRLIPPASKVGSAVTYAAYDQGAEVIRRTESGHSATLGAIVETLYRRTAQKVFERAKWRCEECGRIRPIQAHHVIFRSHGRVDSMENLRALCKSCHENAHRSHVGSRATA